MKTFSDYINEKQNFIFGGKAGLTGKEYYREYNYFPKDKKEFYHLLRKLIDERGGEGDFNDIDTINVTDMSDLFYCSKNFNGDISMWDVSSVTDMHELFRIAEKFNQDISCWDTSKVYNMNDMFCWAQSFNQDLSRWDVSNVTEYNDIFYECPIKEEYKPKFK